MIEQELFERFIKGECSPAESEAVIRWLTSPGNEEHARIMMQRHWNRNLDTGEERDWRKLLGKTKDRIFTSEAHDIARIGGIVKNRRRTFQMAATWLFLALALSAIIFLIVHDRNARENFSEVLAVATEEVESSSGQIVLKVLPDGTKVWLNSKSKLKYPPVFEDIRAVELEGEAFFDVVEDPQRPFIVKAGELTIRVLGTAFNVKSYPGDPYIATTLVRGKVSVAHDAPSDQVEDNLELKPNEQAIFSHASELLTRSQVNASKYTSWTDGKLVFEDAPVSEVLNSLERWYGVNIHVKDDGAMSCALTARIDKEPLRETLELLKSITGVNYRISGNDVFVEGNICGQ